MLGVTRRSGAPDHGPGAPLCDGKKGVSMRILTQGAIAAGLLALTACGTQTPAENAADNVESMAENQSDMLEGMADNTSNEVLSDSLENQADAVEDAGENRADAIEANAQPPADTNGM